jgi:hypothetical protein
MSPTAVRLSAIPLGLLAFASRLVMTFWVQPLGWHFDFGTEMLIILSGTVVSVGLIFGVFALLGAGGRLRPARFTLGEAGFVVPASPAYGGSMAIMLMFFSGGFVMSERVPNGDSMRLARFGFAMAASVVMVGLFWIAALAFLFMRRPRVYLDADGLTIRRVWRATRIAWDWLAPGGPPPPRGRWPRDLRVHLNGPLLWGQFPPSEVIPVGQLCVDPAFLAATIRHYVEHPEARAAIGTVEELARLQAQAEPDRSRPASASPASIPNS